VSETGVIQYEVDGHVGSIWLNRPEKRNALNAKMAAELDEMIRAADADPNIRVIVVRGRGGTFCAGMDVKEIQDKYFELPGHAEWLRTANRLRSAKTPSVAVLEGHVVGGAHSLMMCFDFAIASTEAKLGDYYIHRGIVGGVNAIYQIPRVIGLRKAKELIFTGKLLSGTEAAEWGLVNLAVTPDKLDEAVRNFVAELADKSPFTMSVAKRLLNSSLDVDFEGYLAMQDFAIHTVLHSEDEREGVAAFLEKRKPQWKGR
jgi:enoyl-CoA hydratase/carnithine racemase